MQRDLKNVTSRVQ